MLGMPSRFRVWVSGSMDTLSQCLGSGTGLTQTMILSMVFFSGGQEVWSPAGPLRGFARHRLVISVLQACRGDTQIYFLKGASAVRPITIRAISAVPPAGTVTMASRRSL